MSKLKGNPEFDVVTLPVCGVTVHVYTVPDALIGNMVLDKPRPKRPIITVKVLGGKSEQQRPAKDGDPEWDEYAEAKTAWDNEQNELRADIRIVKALLDFDYPDPFVFPADIQQDLDDGLLMLDKTSKYYRYRRNAMYLRATVLKAVDDQMELTWAIEKRSGTPDEVIAKMKDNFWRDLYGSLDSGLGAGSTAESDRGDGEAAVADDAQLEDQPGSV